MSNTHEFHLAPDYLFEVSWEVCNKVGGIHTVIATKALTVEEKLGDHYILIGPDIHREEGNLEFEEDPSLLADWRETLYSSGVRVRIGHWKIEGRPVAVLVDFTEYFSHKDEVLKRLWESYRVDSLSGQWDYIEPVLFGFAAAKVIESYVQNFCSPTDKIAAHFHEWMTSSGGLYLMKHDPNIATVFTTHATVMGRSIAGNGMPLYGDLTKLNADELARKFGVVAKHSLEKTAAEQYDCFTTVSDLTARECKYLLHKDVDLVTPNGFEDDFVWADDVLKQKRKAAREQMIAVAEICLGIHYDTDPLIVGTSGRYEFKNKGLDVFVDSLIQLADGPAAALKRPVLAYITVPAGNVGPRKDLQARLKDPNAQMDPSVIRNITHYLSAPEWDPDHRQDQKHEADGSHQPGAGDVRPFVPQRRGRDLRQGLLRTALRHGRHRIPFLLRTVGLHAPRKRRVQRTDDHHLAGGIRPLGGRALQGTQRRRGDRPQRRQRLGGSHRNRLIDREVLQHERKRVRLVPGIGAQNLRNRALGEPVRLLRARLRRRARQDDRA